MRWNVEGAWPLTRKDGSSSGVVSHHTDAVGVVGDERKDRDKSEGVTHEQLPRESIDDSSKTWRKLAGDSDHNRSAWSSFRKPTVAKNAFEHLDEKSIDQTILRINARKVNGKRET